MNMLVGIMALVSIFVQVTAQLQTAAELKARIPELNNNRKNKCQELGLPAPADMTWDDQLASRAASASGKCEDRISGPNQIYYAFGGDDNAKKIESYLDNEMDKFNDNPANLGTRLAKSKKFLDTGATFAQLYNPDQTSIGCADKPCTGQIPSNVATAAGTSGNTYKTKGYCILGPAREWREEVVRKMLELDDAKKSSGSSSGGGAITNPGGGGTQSQNTGSQGPISVTQKAPGTPVNPPATAAPPASIPISSIPIVPESPDVSNDSGASAKTNAPNSSRLVSSINALLLAFLILPIINFFL